MRKMKDSGIAWIGEIPEECSIMRAGLAFSSVLGKMVCSSPSNPEDKKLSYICAKDVHFNDVDFSDLKKMWFSPKDQTAYSLEDGDLLVVEGGAGAGGAATIPDGTDVRNICFQNSLHRIRAVSDAYDTRYFMYYIGMIVQKNYVDYVCNKATIPHFTKEKIMSIPLVMWSIEQQRAIVAFLDKSCSEIDATIRKTEYLIEKIDSYKQSLITETVTKGLHPEVARKDSGIEWIGEIPSTWTMEDLKYLTTKIGSGKTPKGGALIYRTDGVLFLRSQNIYDDGLMLGNSIYISEQINEEMSNTQVKPNDVLLNITGGSIGRCCLFPANIGRANVNQHVCIIRCDAQTLMPQYLHYFWMSSSGKEAILCYQSGANREGLNFEQIKNTSIPIPSMNEQREIVAFLDAKCAAIDADLAKRRALIERLSDYKRSLIYEVVTGKREVG